MALADYTARKSLETIAAEGEGSEGLNKSLKLISLVGLGIGCIIGAGIFVLTGEAAAKYAGPAVVLSFVIAGIACAFVGLCYSELAAMVPASGSAYTYTYATIGELFAWIIGWDLILEYAMGASTVAVGWSGYFVSLLKGFGIIFPAALTLPPGETAKLADGSTTMAVFNLPAALIVAGLTVLLMLGTKESTRINNIMVGFKLFVVITVIAVGAFYITPANWVPFIPPSTSAPGVGGQNFGIAGVFSGASVVFFAYIGFDAISTAAQEAENPQRDMPLAILGSLVLCTLLYCLMAGVMTGMVHYTKLDVADPVSVAIDVTHIGWLAILVKAAALVGLTTVIFVLLFGQSRVLFAMSRDGLMPKLFSTIHPRFDTPFFSQLLIGVIVAAVAGLTPIRILHEMVNIGTLFAFLLVCIAVLHLRQTSPDVARPFKVPFVPVIPVLGILCSGVLIAFLPTVTWLRLVIWLAIGMMVYFGYSVRHSKLREKSRGAPPRSASAQTR